MAAPSLTVADPVKCSRCGSAFTGGMLNRPDFTPCPSCGASIRVAAFPALGKAPVRGRPGEILLDESDASCFFHERKKASTICSSCGRFLCALCDIELGERHLCPTCLETSGAGASPAFDTHRVLYDNIALAVAALPLLMFPLTVLTAPMAVFLSLRYWRRPAGVVPRTKIRLVLALALAGAQILGWGWFFLSLFKNWFAR